MSLGTQFDTAIVMMGMGLCFGVLLDIYLRIRPDRTGMVYVTDILFWMNYAILLFGALYRVNDGVVRLSFFLFWLAGCLIYVTGLRVFILPIVDGLFFCLRLMYRTFYTIIRLFFILPLLFLANCMVSLARMSKFLLLWVGKVLFVRPWKAIGRERK